MSDELFMRPKFSQSDNPRPMHGAKNYNVNVGSNDEHKKCSDLLFVQQIKINEKVHPPESRLYEANDERKSCRHLVTM